MLIFSLYNCNIITSVNTDNMSVTITTTCKEKAIRKLANLSKLDKLDKLERHIFKIVIIITH